MLRRRVVSALCALLALSSVAACSVGGAPTPIDPAQLAAVAYQDDGPPRLTLITVLGNSTGAGKHTALMVSGSQRVIFDPAGPHRPGYVTAHDDVLYGITDAQLGYYRSAHARSAFHIVTQTIDVPPEVAEQALALVQAQGPVANAFCARSTSTLLSKLPGFEDTRITFFPEALMTDFAKRPGVATEQYFEDDAGNQVESAAAAMGS